MVVQRGAPVTVWGCAAPGSAVRVTFARRTASATADATGRWKAALPAMQAGGPHELAVEQGASRIVLRDVLVGDVWVASGQSNMEWPLSQATDAARVIAAANDAGIRHFAVPHTIADQPADDLEGGEWKAANPRARHASPLRGLGRGTRALVRPEDSAGRGMPRPCGSSRLNRSTSARGRWGG